MQTLAIATSREVGRPCIAWAQNNLPEGFALTGNIEACDYFISIMYDKLLSEEFIASKKKCWNFHPGVLPGYRGSGAFSWTILNGEDECGITLHEIDKSIDHGDIIQIQKFPVGSNDTAYTLYLRGMETILKMFINWLPMLLRGEYTAFMQDEDNADIYYRKDLEEARDLTHYARAFEFKDKGRAYYFNDKGEQIDLVYETTP